MTRLSAERTALLLAIPVMGLFMILNAQPTRAAQRGYASSRKLIAAATVPVTNTLDSGPGSLRQAVLDATDGDTIVFDSGVFSVPLTITLTSDEITIGKSLAVDGTAGGAVTPTIAGFPPNPYRIGHGNAIQVPAGVTVTLRALRVVDGNCNICPGGGISNLGTLTLYDSVVANNSSYGLGRGPMVGGGIYNTGALTIVHSTVVSNSTNGDGGGIYSAAGSSLWVIGSTITGNCATCDGGAIYGDGAVLSVTDSLIAGNCSAVYGQGGGLYNSGSLALLNTTVADNQALFGGGIANEGTASVANGTITSNTAATTGGGILNTGALSLTNATLAGNRAPGGGGGGLYNIGAASFWNTIIAHAVSGGNCVMTGTSSVHDGGHNLEDTSTCGFTATTSLTDTDPLLGPLQINPPGVPILTMALLPGSPAIDNGDDAACPATDERGIPRPYGAHCDIGAFEATFRTRRYIFPVIYRQ